MKKITIKAADGYLLSALYSTPPEETSNTVVLSSAIGVRKEFYIEFSQYLVQNGYNVLLFDYRGIGESAPQDLKKTKSFMHEWGTMDMNAALNYVVQKKGKTDIIWLGHSIGGQLVALLEKKAHIKKVIAINAALGYWGYFSFPRNIMVWSLWYLVQPVLIKWYGYGKMKKIGWGENLPANILKEWKQWCVNRNYFLPYLESTNQKVFFDDFSIPLTAVYTSDDYIANDITVPLMLKFFPNAPSQIKKLTVRDYTKDRVGHNGIFRKKFEKTLWPALVEIIEN